MVSISTITISSSSSSNVSSGSVSDYEVPVTSSVDHVQRVSRETRVIEVVQEAAVEESFEDLAQVESSEGATESSSSRAGLQPFIPPLLHRGRMEPPHFSPSSNTVRVAAVPRAWTSAEATQRQAQLVESLLDGSDELGLATLWPEPECVQVNFKDFYKSLKSFSFLQICEDLPFII